MKAFEHRTDGKSSSSMKNPQMKNPLFSLAILIFDYIRLNTKENNEDQGKSFGQRSVCSDGKVLFFAITSVPIFISFIAIMYQRNALFHWNYSSFFFVFWGLGANDVITLLFVRIAAVFSNTKTLRHTVKEKSLKIR